MTIVILEIKNGSSKITSAWQAADIQDAANKVAFKNGGWTVPYELNEPDADDAADEFVRHHYLDNAASCVILTSMEEAAIYLNFEKDVLETIARAF